MVCVVVALVSLASNWVSVEELSGQMPVLSYVRKTVSKLVNTGTLWAALPVLAGWCVRRPWWAALAGVLAAEGTLALHYALGRVLGLYTAGIWSENAHWFAAGVVLCAPLGLVGWVARNDGWPWGVARLVVPVGALVEPWVIRMFSEPAMVGRPERWAAATCGAVLTACGAAGVVLVVRHAGRRHAGRCS